MFIFHPCLIKQNCYSYVLKNVKGNNLYIYNNHIFTSLQYEKHSNGIILFQKRKKKYHGEKLHDNSS